MVATLHQHSILHDKNLFGAANGGEAVGDDEGGASAHQVTQAFLDQRFGFGVQAAGGLVQNQNARVGQNCAGDGNALLLSAGKLDPTFPDQRVVFFLEVFREFVDASDAAGS